MTIAATIWRSTDNQEGEFSNESANAIVDPSGVALVDPSAVAIYDTGLNFVPVAGTIWTNNEGL
jgi:hypothetical protein